MKSTAVFTLLLSSIGPAFATPNPEITAPAVLPDILARQLSTTIVGYFTKNGSWNSVWCNAGWRYCTQGNYAVCGTITENACNVGTSCISTNLYVDTRGVTSTCSFGNNTLCGTDTVYQSPGDPTPITSIVCRAAGSAGLAVYRNFPNTGLTSSSSSSRAASTSISSTLATSTASTSSSASSAPISDNNGSSKSKAWIAGPVLGGLAVLGALIFGFILLRRRKAKKAALKQAPPMQHHQPPPMGYAQGPEKTPAVGSHPQQYGYPQSPQPYGSPPQQYGYPQQGYHPQSPPAQHAHEYAQPAQLPAQQQPVYELGLRQ